MGATLNDIIGVTNIYLICLGGNDASTGKEKYIVFSFGQYTITFVRDINLIFEYCNAFKH